MPAVTTDPIHTLPLVRPGKPPRLLALLSRRDEHAWTSLARRVAGRVEGRLDPGVLAGRLVRTPAGWAPGPLGPPLERARERARRLGRHGMLLRTDVRAFYPSIRPDVARRALLAAGADVQDATLAARLLESWGSGGYRGLPIGPWGSAVIANAVLRLVDRAVEGRPFIRWVDDYLVAVRSEADVAEVLDRLDAELEALGLERSGPKTAVTVPDELWPGSLSGR